MAPTAKILVVDDDALIRKYLEKVLTHDGHQVLAVESGEAALECIAAQEFDLALVDLMMPGIEGMEVLAALRQQAPDTVAIVLTAHASLETSVEALRQGAHDYLFKPCKTVALRESVRTGLLKRQQALQQRELLAQLEHSMAQNLQDIRVAAAKRIAVPHPATTRPAEERTRFLQRGALIVDFMRHVIMLEGHLLELSPTEFDLLAYLVSEAPRVVSSQELMREVQGYEGEVWEAHDTVRYHVYRIRRKIKVATGLKEVIRTVRGIGYTIREPFA
ncbi:MAG: response regulator transcription factor [Anaerolineae bacterium]